LANVERGPRVFYELDPTLWTAGPDTFIGNIFSLMKLENIAAGTVEPYPQLSLETIIAKNPEIILLGDSLHYGTQSGETLETIKQRPGWNAISAVENDRIYLIDPDLLSRAGPRMVIGVERLATLVYPELYQ
jgi:iron complex transport system substrate-binding protein